MDGIDDLAKIGLLQSQNAFAHGRLLQGVITQPFPNEDRPAKMRGLQSFDVLSRGGREMQVVFGYLVAARARVWVNAVYIVGALKGVEGPGNIVLKLVPFKEHDGYVDAAIAGCLNAGAQAVEIVLVEASQVELGLTISRQAWSAAYPGLRLGILDSPRG